MKSLWGILLLATGSLGVELTFELPDNAKQCFYEEIKEGTKATVEFQVVIGGNYDVDLIVQGPGNVDLYKQQQKQFDTVQFTASKSGVYSACFSNEFSTFSHKLVYMNFVVGDEAPLPGVQEHQKAMTKMEASSENIHKNLNTVGDYQTHYRLREMHGRKRAEDLNSRVMWWSAGETLAMVAVFLGQVLVLRSFFSDKKTIG